MSAPAKRTALQIGTDIDKLLDNLVECESDETRLRHAATAAGNEANRVRKTLETLRAELEALLAGKQPR